MCVFRMAKLVLLRVTQICPEAVSMGAEFPFEPTMYW